MRTQAQGTVYEHPLVDVDFKNHEIDFGWYKLFNSMIVYKKGDNSFIKPICIPHYSYATGSSV